jgi:hypothetical protein
VCDEGTLPVVEMRICFRELNALISFSIPYFVNLFPTKLGIKSSFTKLERSVEGRILQTRPKLEAVNLFAPWSTFPYFLFPRQSCEVL